jgi:hypothetical protein
VQQLALNKETKEPLSDYLKLLAKEMLLLDKTSSAIIVCRFPLDKAHILSMNHNT